MSENIMCVCGHTRESHAHDGCTNIGTVPPLNLVARCHCKRWDALPEMQLLAKQLLTYHSDADSMVGKLCKMVLGIKCFGDE